MTELEKFKRRMIRIVARLHLKEKKPEDELWEDLKKETKCDCKWLWERMRTLTLKRLKRLIIADDRHECITSIARMSITDWLLYDLILVHEKIDVIGADMMGEKKVEPRPLFELFSLVQRFELEGLTGERLAAAWTAATFAYNHNGRQCSPMLLQRRWYQMKEATRNRFYKFWYTYRGNLKFLQVALNDTPTRLQMAIAKRYPHIITKTFLTWEDMIEKRMVILPEEFQTEMKKQTQALPKPSENDSDLILLEPEIETIDLRVDSDSDNELKEHVESEESAKISDMETANALAGIGATPKLEPEEISDDEFGDIEALENIEIPMAPTSMEVDDSQNLNAVNEEVTVSAKPEIIQDNDSEQRKTNDEVNEISEPEIILDNDLETSKKSEVINESVEPEIIQNNDFDANKNSEEVNDSAEPEIIQDDDSETSKNRDELNESAESEIIQKDNETPPQAIKHRRTDEMVRSLDESTEDTIHQPLVIPQITNVFGNVHIEVEMLAKLSNILDHKIENPVSHDVPESEGSEKTMQHEIPHTETYPYDDDDEDIEDDIIKTEIIDEDYMTPKFDNNLNHGQDSEITMNKSISIEERAKFDESVNKKPEEHVTPFEVATNLTFDDEGIEFEDDGIIVDDDEHSNKAIKSQNYNPVKREHHSESEVEDEGEEEMAKFDLKLLMDPVVYTKKLDAMSIFKNNTLFKATCKEDIDLILAESKPVSKKNIDDITEEKLGSPRDTEDDDHKIDDDLFDKQNIGHIKEEKLPSCDGDDDDRINDDLFENMSNISELEYIPENKKVKLSSNLLQKPRNRNYNPITLCKNPDFNTRLKRLTVGFLSSTRNRRLLKACKPITIDVSKSFESKIIDNTLYLKSCPNNEYMNKENETDDKFNESQHTTSVMPSAMPVQSLIDIMKTNMEELINKQCEPGNAIQKPLDENSILGERNKVINLPHIDNVRRINQKLLVAEVSPIQVHPAEACIPPVQIVPHGMVRKDEILNNRSNDIYSEVPESSKKDSDICSGKVICSGTVIRGANRQFITHEVDLTASTSKISGHLSKRTSLERMFDKYKLNASQHQVNQKRRKPTGWTYGKYKQMAQTLQSYTDEYLLTVDTLNKMLNLMDESRDNPVRTMILQEKAKKLLKSKVVMKRQLDLEAKLCEYERRMEGDFNRQPGTDILKVLPPPPPPTPKQKKMRGPKPKFAKSEVKKNSSCQTKIKNTVELDENMKKACETIESVVQQTRNLIEDNVKSSLTKTAKKTVDVSTSTTDENTEEQISDTIEIHDTCVDNDVTPIEIDDTSIDVENSASSVLQTEVSVQQIEGSVQQTEGSVLQTEGSVQQTCSLKNNPIIVEQNSTSIEAKSVYPANITSNLNPTNKATPDSISVDDIPVTEVSSIADDNIIEIDDSPMDVSASEVLVDIPKKYYVIPPSAPELKRSRGRPPKIKTKITSAPENVPKRSTASSISRGCKYQYIPCVKDPDVNTDKVLFLSSKNLSKQPNTQPIFLGKNKILLTDVPLPRIQHIDPNAVVISQYIDQSTVSLPKGVDFLLLPNGELTCTIAPDAQLDYEQLALIPSLLSNLRQQMSGGTLVLPTPLSPICNPPELHTTLANDNNEVVNISDDEIDPKKSTDNRLPLNNILTQASSPQTIVQNENVHENENTKILENFETIKTNIIIKTNSEKLSNDSGKSDNKDTVSSTAEHDEYTILEKADNKSTNINGDSDNNIEVENDTTNFVVNVDGKTEDEKAGIAQCSYSRSIIQSINQNNEASPAVNQSENTSIHENVETSKTNCEEDKTEKSDNKDIVSSTVEHNIEIIRDMPESESASTNRDSGINMEVENSTTNLVVNAHDKPESAGALKKTILSDLMEMSGICEEDIMPSIDADGVSRDIITAQTSFTPTLVVGTEQNASRSKVVTPSIVTDASQVRSGNTVVKLPELNPITSFAELKYAFEKSGNFFKLDLATKVLAPINVCIKKNEKGNHTPIAPKILMVDLTDENDESTTIADNTVTETQSEISVKADQSKIQKPVIVKPIKLFKVKRPNILRGPKLRRANTESRLVSILKRHKLQKSNEVLQEHKNKEKDKPYQFEHSEVSIVEDSDDSSDDEPLAKKAQRKHVSTELSAPSRTLVYAVEPVCENVPSDEDRLDQVENLPSDHLEQPKECLPNDRLEQVDDSLPNENLSLDGDLPGPTELTALESGLPTELSFISDNEDNDSDEDLCILGV